MTRGCQAPKPIKRNHNSRHSDLRAIFQLLLSHTSAFARNKLKYLECRSFLTFRTPFFFIIFAAWLTINFLYMEKSSLNIMSKRLLLLFHRIKEYLSKSWLRLNFRVKRSLNCNARWIHIKPFAFGVEQGKLLKRQKWAYFKNKWNLLDLAIIILSWSSLSVFIKRTVQGDKDIEYYQKHKDQWVDLFFLMFWTWIEHPYIDGWMDGWTEHGKKAIPVFQVSQFPWHSCHRCYSGISHGFPGSSGLCKTLASAETQP